MVNLEAFQLDYCPEHLLFRTEIADRLVDHLGPLILIGKPSTGKTTTAKWLERQNRAMYIEGKSTLLQSIQAALKSYETNLTRLLGQVVGHGKPVIFDDIQRLAEKRNRFNDWLFFIAEAFKEQPFVLVTNMDVQKFQGLINEENQRRLYRYPDSTIVLPSYGADQLAAIIADRVEEGAATELIEPAAINYLAAMAKANSYSLSRIFAMLRYWLAKGNMIGVDLVKQQFEQVAVEDWKKQLLGMERHRALFLVATASTMLRNGNTGQGGTVGDVYSEYCRMASSCNLYARRLDFISHVKDELVREGLLNSTEPQSLPKGKGRTSLIMVTNPNPEVLAKAGEEVFFAHR